MNWESKESQENHRLNKQKRLDTEDEQGIALHFWTKKMSWRKIGKERKAEKDRRRKIPSEMEVAPRYNC